jgi:hypothetical protein
VAPCGPATKPIDFGSVNLAVSTDYTAKAVFTNTSTGELSGTLTLAGTNASEFAIKSVDGKPGNTFTPAAGQSMDVELTITPATVGTKTAELNYGITTDCGVAISTITANVIEADLNLAPHDWGLVRKGNPIKYTYTIENTNANDVEIEAITLSDTYSGFALADVSGSLGVLYAQGGTTSFDITFTPNAEGTLSTNLQVKLKNRAELLTAKLSGIGMLPAIKADNIVFPATKVGESSADQNFVIENTSDYGQLEVKSIYLKSGSDEAFKLDLTNFTSGTKISKGQTITVPVSFIGTTVGTKTGSIIVEADNVEGQEPVTFALNEFSLTGEVIPGDVVTLPETEVGPILSCEATEFTVSLTNGTDVPVIVDAKLQSTDFSLIDDNFTIPANSSFSAKVEYTPSGVGTHKANLEFTYSDGQRFVAPLSGTAISENADLIDFNKSKYVTLVGSTLKTHFDLNLAKYNIRTDVAVSQLTLTIRYNGRMLDMKTAGISSNIGLPVNADVSNQTDNNYVTLTYNGAIPLDKNLSFDIPYLVTLGNDTITTISVDAEFAGLSCLTVETATATSITEGCGLGNLLISDIFLTNKGFDAVLIGENPVKEKLGLQYELPYDNNVKVEVYSNSGQLVDIIKNDIGKFGINEEYLDVSGLSSGAYILRFISGPYVKNLTFLKIK